MTDNSSRISVSKDVVRELESLSASERDFFVSFVQRLQENPYDPSVIASSSANGDFFASSISKNLYVYWSLAAKAQGLTLNPASVTISILGLRRRNMRRGSVVAAGKLKPA